MKNPALIIAAVAGLGLFLLWFSRRNQPAQTIKLYLGDPNSMYLN